MLERSATGTLPVGTRYVEFELAINEVTTSNDGSADNLFFKLLPRLEQPVLSLSREDNEALWLVAFDSQTNRLYTLERSTELPGWTVVSPATTGTGNRMTLTDTNRANGQAFYRVNCRSATPP